MKTFFKILLTAIAAILLAAIVIFFFYLPGYLMSNRVIGPAATPEDGSMTVMSANVRYIALDDLFTKSWFYRADLLADDIDAVKPDIIGFQEATFVHYDYLTKLMNGYDSEMAYRDDFVLSEGCPIFWRTDRFEKVDSGSFWLSETPEVMSKDWGSEHYRICVYVRLRDLATGKEFLVFNTHLDHTSDLARINGIKVVLDKIAEMDDLPAYLMGDLNAREDEETIQFTKDSFDDSQKIASVTEDTPTFQGWGESSNPRRIDYIMISKGDAEVLEYRVVNNLHDGIYSSDHSPIYIKTKLN